LVGAFDTAPLYKRYNIETDPTFLDVDNVPEDSYELGELNQHSSDIECLLAQQHTLLWSEVKYLKISPGENNKPLSIIYEEHAEELSFTSTCIYTWGKPEPLRLT
jgi:hypothetical protein